MSSKTSAKNMNNPASQPMNFYFGGLEGSGILNSTETQEKTSTNYIILQNDFLHTKVSELENELREITEQVSELEDDNQSLERSKTSLKGYVSNQGELNRLSKKLVDAYDSSLNGVNKAKEEIEWNLKFIGIPILVLVFVLFLHKLYWFDMYGIIEYIMLSTSGFYIAPKIYKPYSNLIKIQNIKNQYHIVKIKEEMKEASKGNDFLNDLIDKL